MQREQNVGMVERVARVLGGGLAALVGLALLLSGPATFLLGAAALVLVLLGLDFVITGLAGYYSLYHRLGWSTAPGHRSHA